VVKAAGLPAMRFHDLRHNCATLLLSAGVDPKSVATRLGHSNPAVLLTTYAHVLPSMDDNMAAVMGVFLSRGAANSSKAAVNPPTAAGELEAIPLRAVS
jgi:integrase